jgi:UDP-N-acetylmuramyl pentapeptide phosphotransferase/UDP-N-acetylglucosamine-1-phosphate transferase
MIDNGFLIDNLHGLFGLYEINRIIAQILTIFVVISIINAINFIDGIDGLAISIIAIFIISFEFFSIDNTGFFSLSIIILACLLPSYIFNFRKKNKIFLGDSGSYLLGGITSIYVLNILSQNYIIKPEFDIHKIIFVMSILSYPVIDITRVFILRVYNRKSPFLADKNHLHHLLNKNLNSQAKTTAVIVFFSITSVILVQIFFNQKIPFI